MTLFQRLARLYVLGVKAIFVFDGPDKPLMKRNHTTYQPYDISDVENNFRKLVELFGFISWNAAGEAEAECAKLLELNIVDLIVTDDVDALVFGARKMITNWQNDYISYYDMSTIEKQLELDRDGLVLIGLLAGNDYMMAGTKNIGILTAVGLAKAGLAPQILAAKTYEEKEDARDALIAELKTNSSGRLDQRRPSAATALPKDFPDSDIVELLCHPKCRIGSRTTPKEVASLRTFSEPDLTQLAYWFQETFKLPFSNVVEKFVSLMFPGYFLQCVKSEMRSGLQRKHIDRESPSKKPSITPSKTKEPDITHYFSVSKNIPVPKSPPKASKVPALPLPDVICINRERQPNVAKTCHAREYQVQINPSCMLRFIELVEKRLSQIDPNSAECCSEMFPDFLSSQDLGSSQQADISDTVRTPSKSNKRSLSQDCEILSDDEEGAVWKYQRLDRSEIPETPLFKSIASSIKQGEEDPKLKEIKNWTKVNRQWINSNIVEKTYPDIVREFQDRQKSQAAKSSARLKKTIAKAWPKLAPGQKTITQMLLGVQKSDGAIEINDGNSMKTNVVRNESVENPFLVEGSSSQSDSSSNARSVDTLVIPQRRNPHKAMHSCQSSAAASPTSWMSVREIIDLDSDSDGESVLSVLTRRGKSAAKSV
jgi:5'-3' exonuclease